MRDAEFGSRPGADPGSKVDMVRPASDSFVRCVFEVAVLLLCIRFLEPVLFGSGFYTTLSFHPFWAVVLLGSLQYGLLGGVTAASFASILMEWPARPVGVDISQHYLDLAGLPLYWLITALLIGGYRDVQLRQMSALRNQLLRAEEVNEALSQELRHMDSSLAHAELALVTSDVDGPALLETLLELSTCNGEKKELGRTFAKAAKSACRQPIDLLLLGEDGEFKEPDPRKDAVSISSKEALRLASMLRSKRVVVVPMKEFDDGREGYLACAGIYAGSSENPVGLVLLHSSDKEGAESAVETIEFLSFLVGGSPAVSQGIDSDNVTVFPIGNSRR